MDTYVRHPALRLAAGQATSTDFQQAYRNSAAFWRNQLKGAYTNLLGIGPELPALA